MALRDDRRAAAVALMADHLLKEGLLGARLKTLAAAVGTSDRMLLYYFDSKDALLAATLDCLAGRLVERLDRALPQPLPFAELRSAVWRTVSDASLRPYMHLWLELAAAAARGQEPHRAIAGEIADGFLAWLEGRLAGPADGARKCEAASYLLATIEGLVLLDALGRPLIAKAATVRL